MVQQATDFGYISLPTATTPQQVSEDLSLGLDPALAESQARQILSAGMARYGAPPQPQLIYEALQTQAPSLLAQNLQNAPISLASEITGQPAGSSIPAQAQYATAPPPAQLVSSASAGQAAQQQSQGVLSFDWKSFWASGNQQQLDDPKNAGWKSFGEVPQVNVGYVQGVLNQKDPNRIKDWQRMLEQQGFLHSGHTVDGVMDDQTRAAVVQLTTARAMAEAVWSKDGATQVKAKAFLGYAGIDADSVWKDNKNNPDFVRGVISSWMAARGPGAASGDRSAVQSFADQFGIDNLPQSWQSLLDTHTSLFSYFVGGPMSALGALPVVGRAFDVLGNIGTGNILHHPGEIATAPSEITARELTAQMDPKDLALLQPLVQQTQANQGFLGVLDAYDALRTRIILSGLYFTKDLVSGHPENPFDANGAIWNQANAHADNFMAGILGDQWVQDHPMMSTVDNFFMNTVDDPITYTGVGLAAKSLRGVLKPATRDLFDAAMNATLKKAGQKEMSTAIVKIMQSDRSHGVTDVLHLLGIGHTDPEEWRRIQSELVPLLKPGKDATHDATAIEDYIAKNHAEAVQSFRSWRNRREMLQMLGPVMHDRIDGSMFNRLRVFGAFKDDGTWMRVSTDPMGSIEKAQQAMVAVGMDAKEISSLLDEIVGAEPKNMLQVVNKLKAAMMAAGTKHLAAKGLTQDGFNKFWSKIRKGRNWDGSDQEVVYAPVPDGHGGFTEASMAPTHASGLDKAQLEDMQGHIEQELKDLGDAAAHPELADHVAQKQAALEEIKQSLATGGMRPAPMSGWQLADSVHIPYSAKQMLVYSSPLLRRAENLQHFLHMDYIDNLWKQWQLFKLGTSLRIVIGEDMSRPVVKLFADGNYYTASKLLGDSLLKQGGLMIPGLRRKVIDGYTARMEQHALSKVQDYLSTVYEHSFIKKQPGEYGYKEGLWHTITRQTQDSPDVSAWLQGGDTKAERKAALRSFMDSDHEIAQGVRAAQNVSKAELDHYVDKASDYYEAFYANSDLMTIGKAMASGDAKAMQKAKVSFDKLTRSMGQETSLPLVSARRERQVERRVKKAETSDDVTEANRRLMPKLGMRRNGLSSARDLLAHPGHLPEAYFHGMTTHMVNSSRDRMLYYMRNKAMDELRATYKGVGGWDEARMEARATSIAMNWMKTNTYQGGRTIMGSSLRNVFPFWGATANQTRFYQRMLQQRIKVAGHETPFKAGHVLLRGGAQLEQQARLSQDTHTAFGDTLGALGFEGGDALSFNPMNAFFVSRDGLASFSPGWGPLFTPLFALMAHDHELTQAMQAVPGVAEQFNYQTGQARPLFPQLTDVAEGLAQKVPGPVGGVLRQGLGATSGIGLGMNQDVIDQKVEAKLRQEFQNTNTTPTQDDIDRARASVGSELILTGALQWATPFSPSVVNTQQQALSKLQTDFRNAADQAAKDKVTADALGVKLEDYQAAVANDTLVGNDTKKGLLDDIDPKNPGLLLVTYDHRVPSAQRDAIAVKAPWTTAQSTSFYDTSMAEGSPASLAAFDQQRALGNISLISPEKYVANVTKNVHTNEYWLQRDRLEEQNAMVLYEVGQDKTNPLYLAWKDSLTQALGQLDQTAKDQGVTVAGGAQTGPTGLLDKTVPLRSLMTWEVIPQGQFGNTTTTLSFAKLLKYREEASGMLAEMYAQGGHSKAEEDNVLLAFDQLVQKLAAGDPSFAQLIKQYSWGNVNDLITLGAQEQQLNTKAAGASY